MMKVIPITMKQANEFVLTHHRHHGKVRGCKFCIGAADEGGVLHGVATPTQKRKRFRGTPESAVRFQGIWIMAVPPR